MLDSPEAVTGAVTRTAPDSAPNGEDRAAGFGGDDDRSCWHTYARRHLRIVRKTDRQGLTRQGGIGMALLQQQVRRWTAELAVRTVGRHYATLQAICTLAIDTDRIGRSPCRRIKLREDPRSETRLITPDQLHTVAAGSSPSLSG